MRGAPNVHFGSGVLKSKAIRSSRVVAFADSGMEAIYEFTVEDMPVTVAVDSSGRSIHQEGPAHWRTSNRALASRDRSAAPRTPTKASRQRRTDADPQR